MGVKCELLLLLIVAGVWGGMKKLLCPPSVGAEYGALATTECADGLSDRVYLTIFRSIFLNQS